MASPTEKELDKALEEAFISNPAFTTWFLSKTKFSGNATTYLWSRSNHPWGKTKYVAIDPATGAELTSFKEGETDVLVVLEKATGERLALHIENKLSSGRFTPLQPELYRARAEAWKGKPKYQSYSDFDTVLVAPHEFKNRNQTASALFGSFIAHEDVAHYVPLFAQEYTCPFCERPLSPSTRYPKYVCGECKDRAVAPDGRSLSFSNIGISGGFVAHYAGTKTEYPSHLCLIDGVKCYADESHMGGIVIQVCNP